MKMKWLLAPPSADDLIRLLRAWRFWVLGTLVGALMGAAVYSLSPPAFRAQATVTVDFNLEQAWPEESDRKLFYYLERETRKLEEVAWSDAVLERVADGVGGVTVGELRAGKLLLSQPEEGGWHFWADDADPERAAQLASAWAEAFGEQVQQGVTVAMQLDALHEQDSPSEVEIQRLEDRSLGISSYIQVSLSQREHLPITRKIAMGNYVLTGATGFLVLSAFAILFAGSKERDHA